MTQIEKYKFYWLGAQWPIKQLYKDFALKKSIKITKIVSDGNNMKIIISHYNVPISTLWLYLICAESLDTGTLQVTVRSGVSGGVKDEGVAVKVTSLAKMNKKTQ